MRNGAQVSCSADPEDGGATRPDERKQPLGGDRRRRERLRERNAVDVRLLLFRAAPDDPKIRKLGRPALQEIGLSPLGLEQGHVALGQRRRHRDPGRAAAGTDVDDRPVPTAYQLDRAQAVVQQDPPSLDRVVERGQAGRLEDRGEPALKALARVGGQVEGVWGNGEFPQLLGTSWEDDDEAIRLGPLARRLDAVGVLELEVHDLALDGGHRFELDTVATPEGLVGRSPRHRAE